MAIIHGRVLGASGPVENSDDNLSVVAVEDDEEHEATVESDGSFVIQLPAGTYRLDAKFEDETATLEAVTIAAQEDKEVVLQLAASVSIKGALRLPDEFDGDEITLTINMRLTGEEEWSEAEDVEMDGTDFAITQLETGKHYDLSFTAEGFRPLKLLGVLAPVDGLVVVLEKPARLRGGFGIARGQRCPISQVIISDEESEMAQPAAMDRYCRFQPDSLPPVDRIRVTVDEADWHFDVLVDIPTHGDPPFLCLKGPCREPGPDELSSLEVTLAGSPG
ncbi:MAG TPA: carboxypeptidase-like regulatory domain-containing protein, partial [Polyangia bacterium]